MATAKAIITVCFPFGATMISETVVEVFEKDETGHCLVVAIEILSDRAAKTPDKAKPMTVPKVANAEGVMGRVSGPNIITSPPLVLTSAEVAKILSALDAGSGSCHSGRPIRASIRSAHAGQGNTP